MEKYKLRKDTFFNKAGTICKLTPKGNMVLDDCEGACILHDYQLKEHPELLDEWFEKIEEKKYGGRAPKNGDTFYYISAAGEVIEGEWLDGGVCEARFEHNNGFWTKEEAEKELARRKAYVILKEDTKGFKPDWENPYADEYYVYYAHNRKHFGVDSSFCYQSGLIYFATRADAEASIKAHEKEWRAWLGVEE